MALQRLTTQILSTAAFRCIIRGAVCRSCATLTDDANSASDHVIDELYPGHIPTTNFQKALLTMTSAIAAITDPARDDMICAMGEASGSCALSRLQQKMLQDSEGRRILEDQPLINKETVDLEYLSQLPYESLGNAYSRFLNIHGFDPDARRPVNFIDEVDLRYVMLRYRQLHDLTHTILGMKPNMLGEVSVKWYEAIQTGLPMCVGAAIAGPVRLGPKHKQMWRNELFKWSVSNGFSSQLLMNFYVERYWETSLSDLRLQLGITPPPCNALP